MATTVAAAERVRGRVLSEAALLGWTVTLALVWSAGLTVDIWYHMHFGFAIESFFTPAHGVLYGAMTLTGLPTMLYLFDGIRLQVPRTQRLPAGYMLVIAGWAMYGMGGGFDFLWHSVVGFEANFDAVLSPSHTWLAVAYSMVAFGLVKASATWRHKYGMAVSIRWSDLPLLVSLALLLRTCEWYLTYVSPLTADWPTGGAVVGAMDGFSGIVWNNLASRMAGANGFFLDAVLVSMVIVLAVRHLRVPRGSVLIILATSALLQVAAPGQWLALLAVVIGAAAGEIALRIYESPWVLGATVPLVQAAAYMALLGTVGGGLIWPPHLWVGVPVLAGIFGLTAAMFVAPPAFVRPSSD